MPDVPRVVFDALVASGAIALLAIVVLAIEGIALLVLARSRRRLRPLPIIANLLSGLCLILALRAALVGDSAIIIASWLGMGGLAHLADVVMRLRR